MLHIPPRREQIKKLSVYSVTLRWSTTLLKLFGEIDIEVSVFVCSMVDSSGAGGLLGLLDFGMMVAPLIALNVPTLRERPPCHLFPKGVW